MSVVVEIGASSLTERQREVLDAALGLLVNGGEALTMGAVAQRASCSKETLYKWFGGRDGLLTATVQWQAAKVRAAPLPEGGLDRVAFVSGLENFARDWLTVLTGETSIALNRLAVGQAGRDRGTAAPQDAAPGIRHEGGRSDLGAIVLENGPFAMRRRLEPLLEAAAVAGLIAADSLDGAFRSFFGLVVRDVQIRLLLGDPVRPSAEDIASDARRAAAQFLVLYETSHPATGDGR